MQPLSPRTKEIYLNSAKMRATRAIDYLESVHGVIDKKARGRLIELLVTNEQQHRNDIIELLYLYLLGNERVVEVFSNYSVYKDTLPANLLSQHMAYTLPLGRTLLWKTNKLLKAFDNV